MNPAVLLRPEIIVFALAVAMILNVGGCRASSDLPGNRHFGTILNNDATNIMYAGTGEDMTPDEYRNGVHRLSYSGADMQARTWLMQEMRAAGLEVRGLLVPSAKC